MKKERVASICFLLCAVCWMISGILALSGGSVHQPLGSFPEKGAERASVKKIIFPDASPDMKPQAP